MHMCLSKLSFSLAATTTHKVHVSKVFCEASVRLITCFYLTSFFHSSELSILEASCIEVWRGISDLHCPYHQHKHREQSRTRGSSSLSTVLHAHFHRLGTT